MTAPVATELSYHIPAAAGLGHVHLKVSDLPRALDFYCGVLARSDLAVAVRRVLAAGVVLSGASDYGVSVSVYLADPDGTGLELTWDRPTDQWPHTVDGVLEYRMEGPLDLDGLLAEE